MSEIYEIHPIAHIHSGFMEKFGIPRQSGLVKTSAEIIFEKEYRQTEAVKGLRDFSHIWLIWGFSAVRSDSWHATVRPPRLGGNARIGVFATRSPFRPNHLGLSSVRLEKIEIRKEEGPVLFVTGADLMDGTPIYDIKPYLPYADSHPGAAGGFTDSAPRPALTVHIPDSLLHAVPDTFLTEIRRILTEDPRPSYQDDPDRIYGMKYAGRNIRFRVAGRDLFVIDIT